jgi:hypothetical protein
MRLNICCRFVVAHHLKSPPVVGVEEWWATFAICDFGPDLDSCANWMAFLCQLDGLPSCEANTQRALRCRAPGPRRAGHEFDVLMGPQALNRFQLSLRDTCR